MGRAEEGGRVIAKNPDWSEHEEYLIRKWYPEKGPSWDAWRKMLPNRTYRAIQQHANRLGVKCIYRGPKSWTKSEDRTAMSALVEVCKTTGRTPEAVIRRLDHIMHEARKKHRKERKCD